MERNDARVVLDYVNAKEVLDQKGFTVVVEDDVGFGVRGSDNGLTGGAFRETFSTAAELAAFALGLVIAKALADVGLKIEWNGNSQRRICVFGKE